MNEEYEVIEVKEVVEANDALTTETENSFHFRSIDPATGAKRESIKTTLPLLTINGLISVIEAGGNGLAVLLDAANDKIIAHARNLLDSDYWTQHTAFEPGSLAWETVADAITAAALNAAGNGIAKEVWEAFGTDYVAVMLANVEGMKEEHAKTAAKLFIAKLQPVKTNKAMLGKLQDRLNTWFAMTGEAEKFLPCYEALTLRINTFLAVDDSSLLENI